MCLSILVILLFAAKSLLSKNINEIKDRPKANLQFIDLNSTFVNLTVGELEQVFTFALDTELTYTWLPSNKSTIAHTNNTYKCQDACEISDQVRSVDYKNINITGVLTTDFFDFDLGDGMFKTIFLNALVDLSVLPSADGSIGLSPKSYKATNETGLIESLQKANIINRPIVAFDYYRSRIRIGSEFEDDYMDRKNMEWVSIVENSSRWEIPIKSYKIGKTEITVPATLIISTAGSHLVVPNSAYELYTTEFMKTCKNSVKIHKDYTFIACEVTYSGYIDADNNTIAFCAINGYSQFPNLEFTFLNKTYTIRSWEFLFPYDNGQKCLNVLSMISRKDNEEIWTFGYPMLQSHYIILDFESQKVGISGESYVVASLILLGLILII